MKAMGVVLCTDCVLQSSSAGNSVAKAPVKGGGRRKSQEHYPEQWTDSSSWSKPWSGCVEVCPFTTPL